MSTCAWPREGIPFLGFTIFPQRRRLKRRKGIHFQRKVRMMADDAAAGHVALPRLHASVMGWVNHVRYGNTVGLRKSILGKLRLRPGTAGKNANCA